MNKIIIFGAGKYGRILRKMLDCSYVNLGNDECKVEYFCDNNVFLGDYVDGVRRISPDQIKTLNKNYLIYISSNNIADEVMKQLHELGVENKVYLIPNYVYDFCLPEGMPFRVKMDIHKPRLRYLECAILRYCNLNCKGCSTVATIRGREMMDINQFEEELQALKKLYSGIKYFKLYGGEPLLHPQLNLFIKMAREYFPDAELVVHSNGLLVPELDESILTLMSKYNVKFVFSLYPVTGIKKRKIEQRLKQANVVYEFREPVYEFRKLVNIKGGYNAQEIYKNCCGCIELIEGTLSCGLGFTIKWLEEKYNVKICEDKFQNCIDIHTTKLNGWEINKKLDTPCKLCSYCSFMDIASADDTNYYAWKCIGDGKAQLSDWIVDN